MSNDKVVPIVRPTFMKPAFKQAEGHEIPLASAKKHGKKLKFTMMDGETINTIVMGFDRFTITVEGGNGRPLTIFKHAIKCFEPAI